MEKQITQDCAEMDNDECPDEFQCCVCLDIMYKPVVLACGHISCFWCVFKAMDTFQESHCPVCRHPYNHFPRICELLHFLLLKLYPSAYKRKELQVAEEEKAHGHTSPQFQADLLESPFDQVLDVRDTPSRLGASPHLKAVPEPSSSACIEGPSERTRCEHNTTASPTASASQATDEFNCTALEVTNGICKRVSVTDLQCAVCEQLLCRPVVLNCGHVFCEACIDNLQDSVFRCPLCQSPHPNGFPNVCLVLEHFLAEQFPEEYSARKESFANSRNASAAGSSTQKQDQASKDSSAATNVYSSCWSGQGSQVHPGVGCDYCGMCPIIGQRYKCKDCVEKIGFDLCEACYRSSSKLPGRFNQQHTPDHQFVVVNRPFLRNIILSLGAEDHVEYEVRVANPDNLEEGFTSPYNALEDELGENASIGGDGPQDADDATGSPVSSSDRPREQNS